jgi:hypothetical protein
VRSNSDEEETVTEIDTRDRDLACRLPDEEQDRQWEDVASEVFAAVEEARELEDGYAFRFPESDEWARTLTEYVLYERGCCPFLRFELVLEPEAGPAWLRLRGGEDVKRFVRRELSQRLG